MSVTAPTPVVPPDWKVTPVEEVCDVQNGYAFKSAYFNDKDLGLPIIRIRDVHSGKSDTFYSGPFDERYLVDDDDLLVGMDGEFRVRKWRSGKGLLNQRVCRLLPKEGAMIAEFLYYSIGKPLKQIEDFTPFTTVKHIAAKQIRDIELPLPPIPEQKKIAHILSTVQRAIEEQERIIQTTTELKKALMHKLFTEGLRNERQKQTEFGSIPQSWQLPTVESVCAIKGSAMSYQQLESASNVSNGVRVMGVKVSDMNLFGNEIEFTTANLERQLSAAEAIKRTVPKDAIVFPKRGAAIATNKKRLTTCPTVLDPNLMAVVPSAGVNHRFLFHWFNTFDLKKITDPGPTPQLNKKDIAPLRFPMPPLNEQILIAAAIDAAEQKATLHIKKRDQLQDLFRILLHDLMTAKTRLTTIELKKISP